MLSFLTLTLHFSVFCRKQYPDIYVAHSFLFHKQDLENSYNGKVSILGGPNLDQLKHVITGLPVSDHDRELSSA